MVAGCVDPNAMNRNAQPTTDRQTNTTTTTRTPGPTPDRGPRQTTAGLVAATLVPVAVVAAAFAPVATLTVAAVLGTFAVAMTATDRAEGRDPPPDGDPGEARPTRETVAAD